jgi:hypothetical protein
MDQSSLVEQIVDGRNIVSRFAADGNPVQAAFWLKTAEEGIWFLYIVSDLVNGNGPLAAYNALYTSTHSLGNLSISISDIKFIGNNNPITHDVLKLQKPYPVHLTSQAGGTYVGSVAAQEIYVYPQNLFTFNPANPMTREEISRKIVDLMNRGPGTLLPSHVMLKNRTSFDGVPFGFQLGNQNRAVVQFIVDHEAIPRTVLLDEIDSVT